MRRPRLKAPAFLPVAYYHCVSRVVSSEFIFGEEERDKLVEYMRLYERFCGLRVISYFIMSNHFHILVEVPQRPDATALPDDAGLVAKVKTLKCLSLYKELSERAGRAAGVGGKIARGKLACPFEKEIALNP